MIDALSQHIPNHNTLNISNGECRQRLHHGSEFKDLLDARDQVLEHHFDFLIPFDPEEVLKNNGALTDTDLHDRIYEKMRKFLVEAVSNVASVAFKFLNKGELTESEAKDYASKNVLLNVHSVFRQTSQALSANPGLKNVVEQGKLEDFQFQFLTEVDGLLETVLANLADGFPMAPATGGSQKMRQNIQAINRATNEEYDLIFANKISIKEYFSRESLKEDSGDYTKYIMQVVNAAIKATQTCQSDSRERTYLEMFQQFNRKLQWAVQESDFKNLLNNAEDESTGDQKAPQRTSTERAKDLLATFFNETFQINQQQFQKLRSQIYNKANFKEKINGKASNIQQIDNLFKQLFQKAEDPNKGVGSKSKSGKLLLGQKIPGFVKQFSKQEIESRKFTAKHSSILRIMTKWAEYLQELFKNPEKAYTNRTYPFKTIDQQLVMLWGGDNGIPKLVRRMREEYKLVQDKFKGIKQSNFKFLSQLLSQEQQTNSNVCRYSQTRPIASKTNAVLTNFMLQYLNVLIHHLLRAGQDLETDDVHKIIADVNLVVFRVSDLMRSKIQCTQSSFVNVLKTFYLLDSHQDTEKKIKLVRIKDRLDSSANDIMINYMFMDKVQCQLQLSIQESKGKEKNYYTFSHFIYELTRGKFGVIAELAIMISQLDPMITASQGDYYTEKKAVVLRPRKQKQQDESHSKVKVRISESIYECNKCKLLVIGETANIFEKEGNICNRCVINSDKPEERVGNKELKEALASMSGSKIKTLSEMNKYAHGKYLIIIDEKGTLSLNMVIRVKKQLKTFLLQLNSKVVEQIISADFDFNSFGYFDINSQNKPTNILYIINSCNDIPVAICRHIKVDKQALNKEQKNIMEQFTTLREEKNMVKAIKFKEQIISCANDIGKWATMDNVVNKLVIKQDNNSNGLPILLKYKISRQLDIKNLKSIVASQCDISQLPKWLAECRGLTKLDFFSNTLTNVMKQQLPPSLQQLILQKNQLKQIDLTGYISLKSLHLGRNKLEKVDIGSLKHLMILRAQNNKLTEICLGNLPNLTELRLNKNKLKKIDVSNLTQLTSLDLSGNKLDIIRLPVSPKLTTICLDDNQLTAIDLSPVGVQLNDLRIHNNKLENIDVSKFVKMIVLWVDKNQLTALDLTQNTQLKQLRMQNNNIKSIEFLPANLEQLIADQDVHKYYENETIHNLKR